MLFRSDDLPSPLRHGTASKVICIGEANPSICKVIHDRFLPAIFLGHFSEIPGTTGNLLGVVEKLDYLQDLGVNALYLCPIFQSTANHRYHTQDYFRVDPILGGDAALQELLKAAHKRHMKVILDGVFNHASRGFYQFNHALENGASSPYTDWFNFHSFPVHAYHGKANYDCWWGLSAPGPELRLTTRAQRPDGPPLQVSVTAVSSSSLAVSWSPPRPELRHGAVSAYNVAFRLAR